MADYRCIYRNAGTGARTSGLSHLGFRVWIQYQLSADDFGVCPAVAAKLQGDNDALLAEAPRKVQAEIEKLIAVGLCGAFMDGQRRYLYQPDWQDWQRLRHATSTALPAPPAETLRQCSGKTIALFEQFHPNFTEGLRPHAGACDAPAVASASAIASVGGPGEPRSTPFDVPVGGPVNPRRVAVADRAAALGIVSPKAYGLRHAECEPGGFCGWMCLPAELVTQFANRLGDAAGSRAAVLAWATELRDAWQASRRAPTGRMFEFWAARFAEWQGDSQAGAKGFDPLSGVRAAVAGLQRRAGGLS